MDGSDIIQKAIELIGQNKQDDYILDPVAHYQKFQGKNLEFAKILKDSDVVAIGDEFKNQDLKANKAKKEFNKWTKRALWASFLTTCLSTGLVTAPVWSTILFPIYPAYIYSLLAVGSVFCGAFAGVSFHKISSGNLLVKWMEKRARTETLRIHYFDLVVNKKPKKNISSLIPLPLLQLEYFNRFQLQVQLAYYRIRGEDHLRASRNALNLIMWSMFGIALVNGIAGVFGWLDTKLVAVTGIALVGQAFVFKVTNTEAINQDSRNAERYERTRYTLAMLAGKLDSVRAGIIEGDQKILSSFAESVNEQISLEHRQWLGDFNDRLSAIGRFEQHVKEFSKHKIESDAGD